MRPDDPADADEKESGKWLAAAATSRLRMGSMMSNVIAVCDREADIHAYLQDKLAHNERFGALQAPAQGHWLWVVSVRPSELIRGPAVAPSWRLYPRFSTMTTDHSTMYPRLNDIDEAFMEGQEWLCFFNQDKGCMMKVPAGWRPVALPCCL